MREYLRSRAKGEAVTMRIFFWDNPLLKRGLAWRKRLNHFTIGISYVWAGFFMPVFFVVPLWTYLTGHTVLVSRDVPIVLARGLYFVLFAIAAELLFRGKTPAKQFQFLVGLFPVYVVGVIRALLSPPGRRPRYRPNNVKNDRNSPPAYWAYLLPQLSLMAANALLPFYALYTDRVSPWVLAANMVVSAFALWALWPIVTSGLVQRTPGLGRTEA